ncbi:MAG: LysM peptidoglycan-binding domain-containing protein, partial [Leptospiraceae bacterium]|nr:LysM peptidoglycan-binding domain-containing protein [Leptospiraceae bacterium]
MFSRFYSSIQRHPVRALILVICLHPAIMVADTSILHRQAVSAPPATLASLSEQNEGAEIDQEIERYFSSMHNRSSREIDAERLERLFGEAQVADHGTEDAAEGELQFSNQSNGDMFSHRVVSGDTIWNLSKKYSVTTDSIIQNNPELKTRTLYIGEEILISKRTTQEPTTTSQYVTNYYSVRPGDSLSVIARRHGVSLSALFRWNNMNSRTVIHPGQRIKIVSRRSGPPNGYTYASFFEWPIRGTITSGYGTRTNPF